jgi:hypothetical protein
MIPDTPTRQMTWWERVKTFEPALLRAVLAALITVAATVGFDLSGIADKLDVAWTALYGIIPLLAGWWIRRAVVPKETVVEQAMPNGEVIAGPANEREMTGTVVRELNDEVDLDEAPDFG